MMKKIIILVVLTLIIEAGIFNFSYIVSKFDKKNEYNVSYNLQDMTSLNWSMNKNGNLVSDIDANLIIEDINLYVKNIAIRYTINKDIDELDFFYTDKGNQYFSGDNLKVFSNPDKLVLFTLNKEIKDIRIDLGDEKGIVLSEINVIINPVQLNISISRIIAILLIYCTFSGLFALQRSPKFDV